MHEMIETIRVAVVAIWAVVMTALAPMANALLVLVIFAVSNAFVGYLSNWITKQEKFSFRKFWRAFVQLTFYLLLTIIIYLAFSLFGELGLADIATRVVVWISVWGYTVKILQNFLLVSPKTRGVRLLYNLLAVKFIPRLLARWGVDIDEEEMRAIDDEIRGLKREHKGQGDDKTEV